MGLQNTVLSFSALPHWRDNRGGFISCCQQMLFKYVNVLIAVLKVKFKTKEKARHDWEGKKKSILSYCWKKMTTGSFFMWESLLFCSVQSRNQVSVYIVVIYFKDKREMFIFLQTHDSKEHLAMMERILGPLPNHMIQKTR